MLPITLIRARARAAKHPVFLRASFLIAKFPAFVVRCLALKQLSPKLVSIRCQNRTAIESPEVMEVG